MRFGPTAILAALLLMSGAAAAQPRVWHKSNPDRVEALEREVSRYNSPTLKRFGGEEEFRRYLGAVLALERARNGWYGRASGTFRFAWAQAPGAGQSDAYEPICPPEYPDCAAPESSGEGHILVTGSRIPAPTNPSITNNQMRNVEEGDIVKQINQFLLVLQDGRIFVIDTRGGGGRRLVLSDRTNVYRDPGSDMWYDEMLVFGDRVLITGYSYEEDASELAVFRLDAEGRLSREGVFHISSNDYYSSSNYATRLIGDNLVIYTPFEVADMARPNFAWPVVRRWLPEESRYDEIIKSAPLFDAAEIYRPVRATQEPTVHSVSVCPLGPVGSDRDLECRTTAFVGPNTSQWYVTESDAFLWTTSRGYRSYDSRECDVPPSFATDFGSALAYRVPLDGATPGVAATLGVPSDQFSLHSNEGRFRALLKERQRYCENEPRKEAQLAYLDFPLSGFADTVREVPRERYAPLPGVGSHHVANRFTDRYLVYGSLGPHRRGLSDRSWPPAFVLPVGEPRSVRPLHIGHSLIRAEQAGNDIVLTGYRNKGGLLVTLIDLDRKPHIASSVTLDDRYESEGRSHAFNSLIEPDGSGVMGLPTVRAQSYRNLAPWRSSASDLSFLTVDRRGRLQPIGELERRFNYGRDDEDEEDGIPGYSCEVSCIDWYGNSRPIFTDGRVFALTGTELIEGRIGAGEIFEVQRLNIALPAATRLANRGTK